MQSGITIYDTKTGQPYCFYTEYGVPTTRSGECSAVLGDIEPVVEESASVEETASSTPDIVTEDPVEETSSTTPDVVIEEPVEEPVATTTPEIIVEEPVVEETSTSTDAVIIE